MEQMLVVIFENELKAYDGSRVLSELDAEGSISIHARAVIMKNAEGKLVVKQEGDDFPIRTVGGTAIGALIGLLGGPIGAGIGAVAGTLTGSILDLNRAGVDAEFIDNVSKKLEPSKWAVLADISEEWETPVDTRMAVLGGTVFRATRQSVGHEEHARDVAAIKSHIAQLKAEQAKSRGEQEAKLQDKIDNLNENLSVKLKRTKQRSEQRQKEAKAKVEALEKKAAKAKGDTKAAIEKRIAEIKESEQKSSEEFDRWLNGEELD